MFNKVNIEISNICNLACSFCPDVKRSKQMMEVELFRRVIEQVAPITEQVCFHLMGEPLVHPDLERLLSICQEFGTRVFFVTNGVLLSRERIADLLLHSAIRQVNFSLHSFHDNFGDRDPTAYLEKIFSFTERALECRPDLYVNYRLWNLATPQGANPLNSEMLRKIEERFQVSVNPEVDVRREKSHRLKGRLFLHFDTEFRWPAVDLPVLGESGRCLGLSSHFGVLVDGSVVPCCLDKEGAIPLGNLRDQSIQDILASPRAQAMVKGFRERRLVEPLCQRCQYIERFR